MQPDPAGLHWPIWGKTAVLEYDQGPEHEAQGVQRGLRLRGRRMLPRPDDEASHVDAMPRVLQQGSLVTFAFVR